MSRHKFITQAPKVPVELVILVHVNGTLSFKSREPIARRYFRPAAVRSSFTDSSSAVLAYLKYSKEEITKPCTAFDAKSSFRLW